MLGLKLKAEQLLWLLISPAIAQAPQDPLDNFCRRYGHQTAVVDRKLYIDGGWVYANPIPDNPIPTINQGLLYSDLDRVNVEMPEQHANLSKNSTVPNVAGGILWPDEINKMFWLYGGEFSTAPSKFQLWGYDVLLDQWNLSSTTTSVPSVNRVSYGAGTTMEGKGYYYGGYLNSLTNPLWDGPPVATSTLVIFDMDSDTLTNNTGPDGTRRAEGVMVSTPTYSRGMLVYFGGVAFPFDDSTEVPMSMTDILLYDVADAKWYTQTATGDIPPDRRKFCAGATWAEDQSSYNIYLYGGFGYGENITGFDDVYILSLPTFEWIKWYPETPAEGTPHGLLTCNVIDKAQMVVMGGNVTYNVDCDVPDYGGQHNLNLGQINPTNAKWYQYLPNLTSYSVPQAIISVTGGSSGGGASRSSPSSGFDNAALSVYFGQKAQFTTRTPTRYIPTPTATVPDGSPSAPKHDNIGPIAGGVVGGVVVLIIIVLATWWCLRRRKRPQSDQRATPALPSSNITEMTGESYRDKSPGFVAAGGPHGQSTSPQSDPSSPYSTSPPLHPAHFMQRPHPSPGVQQYYPMVMQQQYPGYGYHQPQYPHMSMSSSPPQGIYLPQGYFPPAEIPNTSMRSPPPIPFPHEMPTSRDHAVGVQHVDHRSSTPNKVSTRDSVSDQERSRSGVWSLTHPS